MGIESAFNGIAVGLEAIGAGSMVVGFLLAVILAIRAFQRHEGGEQAFHTLRTTLGSGILLGLEILVAADLIRTITSAPSIEDTVILGLIVIIRTVLSISIQIEIEGMLPWNRALFQSGGSLLAKQLKLEAAKTAAAKSARAAAE